MSDETKEKKRQKFELKIKLCVKDNPTEDFKDAVVGKCLDLIPHSRLPIRKVILQRSRALHRDEQFSDAKTKSDSAIASQLSSEIIGVWNIANIPTPRIDKIKKKIATLIDAFKNMAKHCERYDLDKEPLSSYCASLENLFDIAVVNLQQTLSASHSKTWKDEWELYQNQWAYLTGQICKNFFFSSYYLHFTGKKIRFGKIDLTG